MAWDIQLVERNSTLVRTLVNANVVSIVEELNTPGEVRFTFPKNDPATAVGQAADMTIAEREVIARFNTTPLLRGVMVAGSTSSEDASVTVTSPDVSWYFTRRFIDKPRVNRLLNPGFESNLTDWSAVGTTATVVTSPRRLGAKAVQLVQGTTGADAFLRQQVVATAGGLGDVLTIAAHYYMDAYAGPALDGRALYVQGAQLGVVRSLEYASFDDAEAQAVDQWGRVETTIYIPPNETWTLDIRLYSPNGTVVWDAAQLVAYESTGLLNADISTLAALAVTTVQSVAMGKDDLSIGTNVTLTGVTVPSKFWQHAEHTPADRAIDEFVERDDGVDWWINHTTKTFHVAPEKGTDRSATVTLQTGVNLASWAYSESGAVTETDVTVLGDGDGPDREEGIAVDTTQVGLVLQGLHATQPGTTVDALGPLAAQYLARGKRLVRLPEVVTYQGAGDLIALLQTGDTVTLVINDGWVQINGAYRIVRREITCRSETMRLTLNEV